MTLILPLMSAVILLTAPADHNSVSERAPAAKKTVAAAPVKAAVLDQVSVTLRCTASAAGRISDCVVLSETRPGYGFGEAALALMDGAEVAPSQEAGTTDRTFEHTIDFMP